MPNSSDHDRAATAPLTTLAEATGYLDGLINRERSGDYVYRRLDLRPIDALLEGIGRPECGLSIIHVAGSKGKGSTCLFAESILRALGRRTGTFTSPHLESWVERFRIDGEPVEEALLVDAVERVRPVVEKLRSGPAETLPSFFDATAAVAFLLFAEARVDHALIEVGLGGRLDSTNIVAPAVTCITSIELEHTDKLGDTEAEIAGEKAGILKPGVPLVLGALRPEAEEVVRARAAEVGVDVCAMGEDFRCVYGGDGSFVLVADGHPDVSVDLATPGRVARLNAALAIMCVRALCIASPGEIVRACQRGLSTCRLPGRVERLEFDPRVLVDAAHTEESARALAEVLRELAPSGFDLLVSVSGDKDLDRLLAPLLHGADRIWTTRADVDRSLPAEKLAGRVESLLLEQERCIPVESESDPVRAIRRARAELSPGRMLVATGSVYLAGIARRVLAEEARKRAEA